MKRKRQQRSNSHMGIFVIVLLAFAVAVIGGISIFLKPVQTPTTNLNSSTHTESSSSSIANESSESSKSETKTKKWETEQVKEMDSYMASFSQYMGQNYKRYYPSVSGQSNLNFYGFDITKDLGQFNYYVDNSPATFNLVSSNEEFNKAAYNIVGVYSDAETARFAGAHLYLLTIHDGNPEVLITMQNQGMPNNIMYFKHTENNELANAFKRIFNK